MNSIRMKRNKKKAAEQETKQNVKQETQQNVLNDYVIL